mmetsp:Transcript_15889/g.33574  ORF Transcript_15889/g.33574 Transcript_15889/m.33574 type:complete len:243 (+) Transcript_15889:1071-1799(+)
MLSNMGKLSRKDWGSTFLIPGTSKAHTTASNSFNSFFGPTLIPVTLVGLPFSSKSWTSSRHPVERFTVTPLSSKYLSMGSCNPVWGLPSNILKTLASVRMAKSMKIVSMHRAEILSQSTNPRAYAMGSHIRSNDPLDPPSWVNHSVKVMSSRSRTMSIPPSKSNSARTMGEVPNLRALSILSGMPNCSVRAKACSPLTGAPMGKRKSNAPSVPPSFTKVCTCSLMRNSVSNDPVRFMMPKRL